MDILATFPTVRIAETASAREVCAPSAKPRNRPPRRPPSLRSIAILAVVAMLTWVAVWWLERDRSEARQPAAMAATGVAEAESVTR